MGLDQVSCPSPQCDHAGACWEADRRRAEAGHGVTLDSAPKMDAPSLVAARCVCGGYRSGPSSRHGALRAWRQHADARIAAELRGEVSPVRTQPEPLPDPRPEPGS